MINFDAVDFSVRRSEEVIVSFDAQCIFYKVCIIYLQIILFIKTVLEWSGEKTPVSNLPTSTQSYNF